MRRTLVLLVGLAALGPGVLPKAGRFRVHKLPQSHTGVRTMTLDARGRLWYLGSHNGKLGVLE